MMENTTKIGYHFVPADYKTFDFKALLDEYTQNNGTILWRTGSVGGARAHKFNVGDVCYFYYSNLPDRTSRILLKGTVVESDTDKNCTENKFSYDENTKGFRVGDIQSVALNHPEKFSLQKLNNTYFNYSGRSRQINQTQRYLDGYRELLDDLLADNDKKTLKDVIAYFNKKQECFFSGKDKMRHETFTMAKGVQYSEVHHFVPKSYLDKNIEVKWSVDGANNGICLCPTCHKRLHHGKAEDVVKRLQMIYENNKKWFDDTLLTHANRDGFDSVLPWLCNIYNLERKKNHYELIALDSLVSHERQGDMITCP